MLSDTSQAAPGTDGSTPPADEIRDPLAYARARDEQVSRLRRRLQELEDAERERIETEAAAKGQHETVIAALKTQLGEQKSATDALLEKVRAKRARDKARRAVSEAGITDPDLAALAVTHLLSSVDVQWDPETLKVSGDFATSAKTIASKLGPTKPARAPRAAPATHVVGGAPSPGVTAPANETWQQRLQRDLLETIGDR